MGINLDFSSVFTRTDGAFHLSITMASDVKRIGIVGASGCGKSATLKAVAGLTTPERGRIVIDDEVLFDSARRINVKPARRRCGLLFQNYQLFSNMTVEQNVGMALIHQGLVSRWGRAMSNEARTVVNTYLDLLHIQDLAHQPVYHLSGGQQQRVALARMLASDPRIIMLDEPFSALDAHLKTQLYPDLNNLLATVDKTVLYVSHDIDEVCRFCDWLMVIDEGRIVEMGDRAQILHRPRSLAALKLGGIHAILPARRTDNHHVQVPGLNNMWQVDAAVDTEVTALGISQRAIKLTIADEQAAVDGINAVRARVICSSPTRHRLLVTCELEIGEHSEALPMVTTSLPQDLIDEAFLRALVPGSAVVLRFNPAYIIPVC